MMGCFLLEAVLVFVHRGSEAVGVPTTAPSAEGISAPAKTRTQKVERRSSARVRNRVRPDTSVSACLAALAAPI